jgi:hypothetical protein
MEKFGVIKSGVTPEFADSAETKKKAEDCAKPPIVDNNSDTIVALDDDFRKRASDAVASKLTSN